MLEVGKAGKENECFQKRMLLIYQLRSILSFSRAHVKAFLFELFTFFIKVIDFEQQSVYNVRVKQEFKKVT